MTQKRIRQEIGRIEDEGLLAPFEKGRYRLLRLTDEGRRLLASQGPPLTRRPPAPPAESETDENEETLANDAEPLYRELRAWQIATAKEAGLPPFLVLHRATLRRIASRRPTTLEQLNAIKGIGRKKLARYGPAVLATVASHGTDRAKEDGLSTSNPTP
jgi:ATP-dependent DNA helicase RecQ